MRVYKKNREVASDFTLWREYYDPSQTMTEKEFDNLSLDEREKLMEDAIGTDAAQLEQNADDFS
jgi:hypothetical protein